LDRIDRPRREGVKSPQGSIRSEQDVIFLPTQDPPRRTAQHNACLRSMVVANYTEKSLFRSDLQRKRQDHRAGGYGLRSDRTGLCAVF